MSRDTRLHVLALCGSLRRASSNAVLLRAAAHIAATRHDLTVTLYDGLADLPLFNPDVEESGQSPPPVARFQHLLDSSSGVLVSSPEYAHGVPGALKNALDWVVGSGEFVGKPVALLNASPQSTWAQAQLTETLRVMSARLVPEALATIPMKGAQLRGEAAVLAHPEWSPVLERAVAAFAHALRAPSDAPNT